MKIGYLWLGAFIATVFGANWALSTFGFVPVGFGLLAPAGVFFAGAAFTCRDMLHETLGRKAVVLAILGGAFLSWWIEPTFAIASGTAFLASESLDYSVYSPLRARGWLRAVTASNVAGLVLDSALFLWLAFGSLDFIEGQIVGKVYMTALAVIALWIARRTGVVSLRRSAA
jgi:uncharacterized PurR-regulated membrane protein YhhQ (DUF165 family)